MVLVPGIGDAFDQPVFPPRKWSLRPSRYGTMAWQRENELVGEEEELPMKLEPIVFTQEAYQQIAGLHNWDWTYEESVRLTDLAWRFDCRYQIFKNYFPDRSLKQLSSHYERLEKAFSSNATTNSKQAHGMLTDDAWIIHLRKNLDKIVAERERIIKTYASPLFFQNSPSLPDLLQKNFSGRRRKSEAVPLTSQRRPSSHKKSVSNETPKNVVRSVQAVTPRPIQKEVLVASEMHWKGIKPSVVKQVEKRMLELGIPLRPSIPSDRICNLYRNLVMRLASEVEKTKRRN
jgi:hypothetical protein